MRCPACIAEGKTSRLDLIRGHPRGQGPQGAVHIFWDEGGAKHIHDHGTKRIAYRCSNNHHYEQTFKDRCPRAECQWNEQDLVKAGQKDLGQ